MNSETKTILGFIALGLAIFSFGKKDEDTKKIQKENDNLSKDLKSKVDDPLKDEAPKKDIPKSVVVSNGKVEEPKKKPSSPKKKKSSAIESAAESVAAAERESYEDAIIEKRKSYALNAAALKKEKSNRDSSLSAIKEASSLSGRLLDDFFDSYVNPYDGSDKLPTDEQLEGSAKKISYLERVLDRIDSEEEELHRKLSEL